MVSLAVCCAETDWMQTPFENAPKLVGERSCVVEQGEAWFEITLLPEVLAELFSRQMHQSRRVYRRLAAQALLDTRIADMFDMLGKQLQRELAVMPRTTQDDWLHRASRSGSVIDLEELDRVLCCK